MFRQNMSHPARRLQTQRHYIGYTTIELTDELTPGFWRVEARRQRRRNRLTKGEPRPLMRPGLDAG